MSSTACGCIWTARPGITGVEVTVLVAGPDCQATHRPEATS